MCDNKDIKDITKYQEITFKALGEMIETAAKKGHSKAMLFDVLLGRPMNDLLIAKGFKVCLLVGRIGFTIEW